MTNAPEASPAAADAMGKTARRGPRRLGCGGCLLMLAGLAVVFVLAVSIAVMIWKHRSAAAVNERLAAIRARGEPASAEDLAALHRLPEGREDCTALWLTAFAAFGSPAYQSDTQGLPIVGNSSLSVPQTSQTWVEQSGVEALLAKYDRAMQAMHQAAAKGGAARFELDFAKGIGLTLEHVQHARSGARMLSLESHVRAHRGDAAGVVESLVTMHRLGECLDSEPILISQLVRVAIHSMAVEQTRRMLSEVNFSDNQLARLQREFSPTDFATSFQQAMLGERVFGITTLNMQDIGAATGEPMPPGLTLLRESNLVAYLDHMEKLIAASKLPYAEGQQAFEAVDLQMKDASAWEQLNQAIARTLTPSVQAAQTASTRGDAANRMIVALIAAKRFQLQHGDLPQRLEQLAPEFLPQVPFDPFDGQPLKYSVNRGIVRIYSVGKDTIDNGGQDDGNHDPDFLMEADLNGPPPADGGDL